MTYRTPAALKAFFEEGDVPTQSQFGDFIDSTHPGWINIVAEGAKNDRTNADATTTAIQSAFTKAKAAIVAGVGGGVWVPPGNFLVNGDQLASLTEAHGGIALIGAGIGNSTIEAAAPFASPLIQMVGTDVLNHLDYFTIQGLTIDGGNFAGDALSITGAGQGAIRDIQFQDIDGMAIDGVEFWDTTLTNLKILNCGNVAASKPSVRIRPRDTGDSATGSNNIRFLDVLIEQQNWRGMEWRDFTQRCLFIGKIHGKVTATPDYDFLALLGAKNNAIMGSNFTRGPATKAHILMDTVNTNESNDNIIVGNQILDAAHGVDIVEGSRNQITNNAFNLNSSASIRIAAGGDNIIDPNISNDTTYLAAGSEAFLGTLPIRQQARIVQTGAADGKVVTKTGIDQSSPAASDIFLEDKILNNSVGDETVFVRWTYAALDITDGSEDGQIICQMPVNGTLTQMFQTRSGAVMDFTTGARFNNGATLAGFLRGTVAYDPGTVGNGNSVNTTVTVTGATVNDTCSVSYTGYAAGIQMSANITSADTATVTFTNHSGGNWIPGSDLIEVVVFQTP